MEISIRGMTKSLLAFAIYYSGLLKVYIYLKHHLTRTSDFTVLMYHQVIDEEDTNRNPPQAGMAVSIRTFRKQMVFLKKHYRVILLENLCQSLKRGEGISARTVVITFDDGWKDNYRLAYPALKEEGLPATIFISTGYIESPGMMWFHVVHMIWLSGRLTPGTIFDLLRKAGGFGEIEQELLSQSPLTEDELIRGLKKFPEEIREGMIEELIKESQIDPPKIDGRLWMLSWEEIRKMSQNRISFGSHAVSHRILTQLSGEELKRELLESKQAIETNARIPVVTFAYPNGDFNPQIQELVKESGYLCACTTGGKSRIKDGVDLFALPRIGIHEGSSKGLTKSFSKATFACLMCGLFKKRR
jgi:peptidoglycan/xylan/chitin deacetylase (PgdA/CDA1 family)